MDLLLDSLIQLLVAFGNFLVIVLARLLPLAPLGAWIAFWLFAVNWVKFRSVLLQGGWVGVVMIGVLAVLVWGTIAPPPAGGHYFLGLVLSNFVGKTVMVTALVCIMFVCGSIQLSGCCGGLCQFEDDSTHAGHDAGSHGHGDPHDHPAASAHH